MSHATLRLVSLVLFVVTTVLMSVSPASASTVTLDHGSADYSQDGWPINKTYDGNFITGWAIGLGGQGFDHTAVWESTADINNPAGTDFTFVMDMTVGSNHTIGKFRLSITTDSRATFADDGQTGGDITANWTPLTPLTVTDTGGATFTINGDNSVFVSGTNPATNTYTIHATTPLAGITGFRLEAFTDPSFGLGGPGRSTSGNFILDEFQVNAVALPEPASLSLLAAGGLLILRRRRSA